MTAGEQEAFLRPDPYSNLASSKLNLRVSVVTQPQAETVSMGCRGLPSLLPCQVFLDTCGSQASLSFPSGRGQKPWEYTSIIAASVQRGWNYLQRLTIGGIAPVTKYSDLEFNIFLNQMELGMGVGVGHGREVV